MFVRAKGKGKYRYLQLVENHREGRRTIQRVICTLGREEELRANGRIDLLIRSLARFVKKDGLAEPAGPVVSPIPAATPSDLTTNSGTGRQQVARESSSALRYRFQVRNEPAGLVGTMSPTSSAATCHDRRAEILASSPICCSLAKDQIIEFSRLAVERHLKRGQFLFSENDAVESWYVVASGMIKAVKHSFSGKDITIAVYGPGQTLANIILFGGEAHLCSGQAIADSVLLEIKRNDFVSFLRSHPKISFEVLVRMLGISGKRFRSVVVALSELVAERTDYRLARTIFTLYLEFGPVIPLVHREIAEMAGTATETTTRFLGHLSRMGVVQSGRGKVAILQQDKLRLLAQVPLLREKGSADSLFLKLPKRS